MVHIAKLPSPEPLHGLTFNASPGRSLDDDIKLFLHFSFVAHSLRERSNIGTQEDDNARWTGQVHR